ncbi:S49 family peptidase [Ferruginivarius sediminum]|uniref:S49 family peptidase n=1 Tax=Ferruginivarius sediminum TaxID=2661937 RepID=A0A369T6E9_9PROT|nr:S49 family peptidase [Ferruginivarius sediminum]RDD60901.1 S49 family peptidase [Ferruginivarius sediminum]
MKLTESLFRLPLLNRIERPPVVSVLRLAGPIGHVGPLRSGMSLESLAEPIEHAFKLPNLSAVALIVNSPGGSPVQSALIAQRIRDLADEKNVKVYAFCEDVAASGGYWLACAADEIYAAQSSIVGSIGVVSAGFGFQDLIQRYGIERRVHASGEKKVILDPFREEDPDDVSRLEAIQAEVHDDFKAMVRARRGKRLKADGDTLFSGEFWTGRRAFELGLVDAIGEARHTLRGIYGDKVRLRPVQPRRGWLRRKLRFGTAIHGGALPEGWAGDVLAALEERALWSRFGL